MPIRPVLYMLGGLLAVAQPALSAETAPPASAPDGEPARVVVGRAAGPIRLDGRLDEGDWAAAGVIADLVQQSPVPGGPSPYHTDVRLLTDGETLYIGVTCVDPDPAAIAIHTMQRDAEMEGDDAITFVFDTFDDQRTGYYFRLNAAAARYDGLIADQENVSADWDGIWDAAARVDAAGWTLEIAIPALTLRFIPDAAFWGFNIQRYVARDRTTLRWTGTTLDALIADMRRDGALEGVAGLRQGVGLSVSPYGLVRTDTDYTRDDTDTTGDAGIDVSYGFTEQLSGVVTVNTDFAETEVDTRQINLTRFPLFYPEKRYFFVEGANQFKFGPGTGQDFIPFFSRRIGLFDGERIPIDVGAKIIGHQGRFGIGVLDVKTGDTAVAPATNLFAARVTCDVDDHLQVGAIGTRGSPDGVTQNWLGGLDVLWQTSTMFGDKNFSAGAWWTKSGGTTPVLEPGGSSEGWGFKIDYPNDRWDNALIVKSFGDSLVPALGFLPRPGVRMHLAGLAFKPRPQTGWWAGKVRQFFFGLYPTYIANRSGTAESYEVFTAPFNVSTPAGAHLETNWVPTFERLDVPFEVAPGVAIAEGSYHFTRYRVEASTRPDRPVQIGTEIWFGDFYDGRLTQSQFFISGADRSGHLQIEVDGLHIQGALPAGDFITRLWQLKTVYAFSPDLVLSLNGQYDSESRNVGVNARMRWTLRPGADLYVVWTRGWLHPPDAERALEADPIDAEAVVKLRWTFRR